LPSLKEPFGTVYGEAMAFGVPVVGWRAGNLPYLAEHEREGLLVEPGDIAGLSQALARLASDPELRQRLGQAARARALQRPTWNEVAGLFFDHLRAVQGSPA
jgi:glycosyltransferase involved in cell wall biosynthesis